ncbi:MAG: DNA repair protein RadC [Patescibacteria group bacterium]
MKMKDILPIDRPREKFEKYGAAKLSNPELLAILLGSGIKGLNVLQLSKKILDVIQKISIKNITLDNLLSIKGLGKAKALQILAATSLGERLSKKSEIISAEEIWKLCLDIRDSKKEHFMAFYLDTQNYLIERQIISIGTLNASLVHPREVFEPAIKHSAAAIIVAHNHPSGNTEPSPDDIEVTKRLVEAGKILGIDILDHVIITKDSFISLKEKGLIS